MMKTMNITLFTIAFTVVMVISSTAVRAGGEPPTILQCAKWMVQEMRNCEGEPGDKVNKPDLKAGQVLTNRVAQAPKKSEDVQGVPFSETCNQIAYWNYQSCSGNEQAPAGVKRDETPNVKAKSQPSGK